MLQRYRTRGITSIIPLFLMARRSQSHLQQPLVNSWLLLVGLLNETPLASSWCFIGILAIIHFGFPVIQLVNSLDFRKSKMDYREDIPVARHLAENIFIRRIFMGRLTGK